MATTSATATSAGWWAVACSAGHSKAEVGRLTKRRDSIVAQLGALRDVVSSFAESPEPAADEEPTKA